MSRPLDGEKEERIVRTAIACFGELGFSGTTMKQIADRAELAPGTIYTYFADKEDLFVRSVQTCWQDFTGGIRAVVDRFVGFYEKVSSLLDYGMDTLRQLHPLVRGMYGQANRLDLINDNVETLSQFLTRVFANTQPNQESNKGDEQVLDLNPYLIKIWVSGILFTISTVTPDRLDVEIERIKKAIKEQWRTQGLLPPGVATQGVSR